MLHFMVGLLFYVPVCTSEFTFSFPLGVDDPLAVFEFMSMSAVTVE